MIEHQEVHTYFLARPTPLGEKADARSGGGSDR